MKKQFIFLITIFICFNLKSQNLLPNKYGLKIGANISSLVTKSDEGVKNPSTSLGFGFAGGGRGVGGALGAAWAGGSGVGCAVAWPDCGS